MARAQAFKLGSNILTGGAVSLTALVLGTGVAGVMGSLESVPLLEGFEEALGVAVSAYYANRLKGNFITATGRETFRLKLIEKFTEVTGVASLAAGQRRLRMSPTSHHARTMSVARARRRRRVDVPF